MLTPRKIAPFLLGAIMIALLYLGLSGREPMFFNVSTDNAFIRRDVVTIQSPVSGQVIALNYDDGDRMRRGQIVLEIDRRQSAIDASGLQTRSTIAADEMEEYRRSVTSSISRIAFLKSSFDRCKTLQEIAERQVERSMSLRDRGFVTQTALDDLESKAEQKRSDCLRVMADIQDEDRQRNENRAAWQSARGQSAQALSDARRAQDMQKRAIIVSPFNSILGNRRVSLGSDVQMGMPLFTLISTDKIWVEANFREEQLPRIHVGTKVFVTTDVVPDHRFAGHIISIGGATSSTYAPAAVRSNAGAFTKLSQWVPVRIALSADGHLRNLPSGASCYVKAAL